MIVIVIEADWMIVTVIVLTVFALRCRGGLDDHDCDCDCVGGALQRRTG